MSEVKLRFAPSPTGYLHIGGLRTALFNYLYARHVGGKFILRIEDTDRTRYVEGALENLIQILNWAGLEYDEGPKLIDGKIEEIGGHGPYIQSARVEQGLYARYARQLVEEGKAYYCFCTKERLDQVREEQRDRGETPRYDGHCRNLALAEADRRIAEGEEYVIRLKLPANTDISFEDAIKGKITINTDEMDDQVLIKSDGFPTYHFAVVLDDHFMGITHIVRGEEWISSTPKHVLLYDSFGWERPQYVHLPTVLGQDGKKLSKRNGDVSVELFVNRGYLKDALINYIALLGWAPKDNEEIFPMEKLIEEFDFDRVSKTGGIFDVKKLDWVNGQYIRRMTAEQLAERLRPVLEKAGCIGSAYPQQKVLWATQAYQNHLDRLDQAPEMMRHLFCTVGELSYSTEAQECLADPTAHELIRRFLQKLDEHGKLDPEFAAGVVKQIQNESGIKGKALWFPLRAGLTGQTSGPDFTNTLLVLGEEEIRCRYQFVQQTFVRSDAMSSPAQEEKK